MRPVCCLVLALAAVPGCGSTNHAAVDGARDAGPRCDQAMAFGAPVAIAELNTALPDVSARLSADELFVVFSRQNPDGTYDLYAASRATATDPFGPASVLAAVNSVYSDLWPTLSADGLTLIYESDRLVPGTFHPWTSHRTTLSSPFGPPAARTDLGDGDIEPYLASDGHSVYFASAVRPGLGGADLWRADVDAAAANGTIGTPSALIGGVNTAAEEHTPTVTGDELTIYFARHNGVDYDVFTASRVAVQDGFGAATAVPGVSAAGVNEVPTWVSPDGCHLYLFSDAPGGAGSADLYLATRP